MGKGKISEELRKQLDEKRRRQIDSRKIPERKNQKSVFLICPVRDCQPETLKKIECYVRSLEETGLVVYWPYRDTNQNDSIGARICADNRRALARAHEVHLWYSKGSQGSLFDFGMLFGLNKKVVVVNPEDIARTPHKSFENVLLFLHETGGRYPY